MTTTVKALGGGAQPASIDTSGKVTGGPALRVYGFDSEADALAAGYVCEGGPAMSVALITDAQIASGDWKAQGDPAALVIYTAPDNMPIEGGYSVPVYPVNGWGSAPAPSDPGDTLRADVSVYYTFEVDGTDDSGHSVTLTPHGAVLPAIVAGKVGNGSKFDPADAQTANTEYWSGEDSARIQAGTSYTWCLWVKFSQIIPGGSQQLLFKADNDVTEYDFVLNNSGKFSFYAANWLTYNEAYIENQTAVQLNTWYFIELGIDAATNIASLRLNNGTPDTEELVGGLIAGHSQLGIGANIFAGSDPSNPLWAIVDEVGFWKRTLTDDERDYLWNSGTGRTLYP